MEMKNILNRMLNHEELYGQMSLPAYGVILSGKQGRPSFQV